MKNHRKLLSRYFPSYHQRKGEPTYFIEKLWQSIGQPDDAIVNQFIWPEDWLSEPFDPKHHTIRAGNKVKAGDTVTFFVWSGRPYHSKQIVVSPPIVVKKVFDFEIKVDDDYIVVTVDGWACYEANSEFETHRWPFNTFEELAKNDGLSVDDFKAWFKWPSNFTGQIICWGDVEY